LPPSSPIGCASSPSGDVLEHFDDARVEVPKGLRAAIDPRLERATEDRQKATSVTTV
jgi:hypothetical protein